MADWKRLNGAVTRDEASPLASVAADLRRNTLAQVEAALQARRVRLAFQPVVMGQDPSRVAFYEGLIRVIEPSGQAIPAGDFIEEVEPTEIGRRIDCASLELGLRTLKDNPQLRLSVNMSARSVGYPRWTQLLRRAIAQHPGLAERLILEITETSALTVPELVMAFMDEFRVAGVTFALDDFGAGMTSFRYLKDFLFDLLKIDGQFIRNLSADPDNQALLRAMLAVARHFEMLTVAEAVETTADAEFLQAEGIGCMQGYLFGAPSVWPAWEQAARRSA